MLRECETLKLLQSSGPPALLVSLPRNDPTLARAAVRGGAQGLKVHLHISHAAGGTHFGSLDQEAEAIAEIVQLGVPVGVVPGDDTSMASPEEMARLGEMGVDFFDVYLQAMPAWMLESFGMGVMAAIGAEDLPHPQRLQSLAANPRVQMVEASVVSHEGYGHPLSLSDLTDYTTVVRHMSGGGKPVIVPTQRAITVADLGPLAETGVSGLLIGAIVTGAETDGIEAATRLYREGLTRLQG